MAQSWLEPIRGREEWYRNRWWRAGAVLVVRGHFLGAGVNDCTVSDGVLHSLSMFKRGFRDLLIVRPSSGRYLLSNFLFFEKCHSETFERSLGIYGSTLRERVGECSGRPMAGEGKYSTANCIVIDGKNMALRTKSRYLIARPFDSTEEFQPRSLTAELLSS